MSSLRLIPQEEWLVTDDDILDALDRITPHGRKILEQTIRQLLKSKRKRAWTRKACHHKRMPSGYIERAEFVDKLIKKGWRCRICPRCKLFAIWSAPR